MEVGQEHIGRLDLVRGVDIDPGFAVLRGEKAFIIHAGFQRPETGCADRQDPFAVFLCGVQFFCGGIGKEKPFRVHVVLLHFRLFHRLERTRADVQGQVCGIHAFFLQFGKGLFREVKSGSGSGNSAGDLGIDRLIAFGVGFFIGALDIRRQGEMSAIVKDLHGLSAEKFHHTHARFHILADEPDGVLIRKGHAVAEKHFQFHAHLNAFTGFHEALPEISIAFSRIGKAEEKNLDLCAGIFSGKQAGADDFGIVDGDDIARVQIFRKTGKRHDLHGPGGRIQHQHPGFSPVGGRFLCDQFFGKLIIKFIDEHLRTSVRTGRRCCSRRSRASWRCGAWHRRQPVHLCGRQPPSA